MANFISNKTGWSTTLTVNQASQSVENNTSNVSWSITTKAQPGWYAYNNYSGSGAKVVVTINGVVVHSNTYTYSINGNSRTWASGIATVPHNADGTKTLNVSFSVDDSTNSAMPAMSGTGNLSLTTIPRTTKATLSTSSLVLGNTVTINLPRASPSFMHKIEWKYGTGAWNLIQNGAGTSSSWTPPVSLASLMPNSTSGIFIVRVTTYNGSTSIGYVELKITLFVPSSIIPSLTQSVTPITKLPGIYVQGFSQAKVKLTETGSYGSTIKSRSTVIKVGTNTIQSNAANEFNSITLNQNATYTITSTITDSRGRSASKTTSITVQAYTPPRLTNPKNYRSNTTGVPKDDGDTMTVGGTATFTNLLGNSGEYNVEYRERGGSNNTWINVFNLKNIFTNTTKTQVIPASTEKEWEVRHTLTDKLTSLVTVFYISSAKVLLDFHSSGTGMAVNKVATRANAVELSDETLFFGGEPIGLMEENLNTLINSGTYLQTQNSRATIARNYPVTKAGFIEVFARASKAYILQRFTTYDASGCWQRTRYWYANAPNDGWSSWKQIV